MHFDGGFYVGTFHEVVVVLDKPAVRRTDEPGKSVSH